ncbi:replicative DNA helicase [Calderihabitans maritimus]|uniref:Replicative DNA helicase n=1 Tax=Calderihabitans maritimus TaxID=1246530 RepID=A0A1Z5HW00_9FIRM|nr:primary replicative DNA helicase [Calderihabitans maritimus]
MNIPVEKVPPHSLDAEQSVLGSLLIEPQAVYSVMEILRPDDFYREAHKIIYEVILALTDRGEPVDLVMVTEELRRRGSLEKVGGASYIAGLSSAVPTAANVEYYARIVAEKALFRKLINAATQIAQKGYEESDDAFQLLDWAEQLIFEIAQQQNREGFKTIKEVLMETFERLERLSQQKGEVIGIPTFKDLDRLLSGLQKGDLIICAARPGMGKTSFCLNIAQNVAIKHKIPVAIFSLEMSKEQLVQRMISAEAMIDQHKLRTGYLSQEDWSRLVAAVGPLSEAPIYIDDTPAMNVLELRAKSRRLKAEHSLGLIVVDYLQLLQAHRRTDSRQQEIAQISRALKALAREMEVPVLTLSQLNRGVEQRQDKRPIMADLLESGAIEADADVVLFLFRPEYYNPDTDKKGIAEVIVAKHRNGPTGTVELGFLSQYTKFVDLAREEV